MTQILFKNIDTKGLSSIGVYEKQGGYRSIKKAFDKKPEEVIEIGQSFGVTRSRRCRVSCRFKMELFSKGCFSSLPSL